MLLISFNLQVVTDFQTTVTSALFIQGLQTCLMVVNELNKTIILSKIFSVNQSVHHHLKSQHLQSWCKSPNSRHAWYFWHIIDTDIHRYNYNRRLFLWINVRVDAMCHMFSVDRRYVYWLCHLWNRPNISWLCVLLWLSQGEHHPLLNRICLTYFV